MRRRKFITLLGAAAAWPIGAYAQLGTRMRRIGAMMLLAEDDPQQKLWTEAFLQGLQEAGWTDRSNIQIDYRWGAGDAARARRYAAELVALASDVILAPGSAGLGPMLQATRAMPPASRCLIMRLARNGWNCLSRSRQP